MKDMIKTNPFIVFIPLIIVFLGMKLVPSGGNFIGGLDVVNYFYWNESYIKNQILNGSMPLWNPYYYCGHPFLANPQTFVFYPATALYVLLPLPWAFNIDVILHLLISALGAYYLSRDITGSHIGGLVAGLAYCFNGYMFDNLFAGHLTMIHTASLIPWVFLLAERGMENGKAAYFIASGLAFGLQILGGEPQNNFYTITFLSLYLFLRWANLRRTKEALSTGKVFFHWLLVPVAAFLFSAVQVLPSFEFMLNSDRSVGSYEFATVLSFPFSQFLTFFIPKTTHGNFITNWEMSGYVGILTLMLAVVGGLFNTRRQHSLNFTILALASVFFMLGSYNPFNYLFYKLIPGFSLFRIPARWIVFLVFSLSMLAGLGADFLNRNTLGKRHRTALTAYLALSALFMIVMAHFFKIRLSSKEMLLALALSLTSFLFIWCYGYLKERRIAGWVLVILVFIDPYLIYAGQTPWINQTGITRRAEFEDAFVQAGKSFHRVLAPFLPEINRGMHHLFYQANGYTPIAERNYYNFIHYMAGVPIFQASKSYLEPDIFRPDRVFTSRILGIEYAVAMIQGEYRVLKTSDVQPRTCLVRNPLFTKDAEEHLQYLRNQQFNPKRDILLLENSKDKVPAALREGRGTPGDEGDGVVIKRYLPNRIDLASVSAGSAFLLVSELYYPGWKAYVDGSAAPVLRADYLLRAVLLPPGRHDISFIYRPAGFIIGFIITAATLLALLWKGLCCLYRKRKECKDIC